jgi:TRAP-type mannitol/chloroaromatic compound transport system permease large subunit
MSDPALGLLMLSLIVVVIMLGFPTAFTLMGLGMFFGFIAFFDPSQPWTENRVFELMVQRTYGAMTNDVLISIPLFVLMGYVMERGALVDKMFYSIQLAFRRVPASLAVATLIVCTFWGIASGLVGAVVVLMGVIAFNPMLRAGYDVKLASGVITAGGTLGILIPPSVMIIVYAAVAGQSVVKLYAAAMFPGFFLAFLYLVYIVGWAMLRPKIAPPLPVEQTRVPVPAWMLKFRDAYSKNMPVALVRALLAPAKAKAIETDKGPLGYGMLVKNFGYALVPLTLIAGTLALIWWYVVIHQQAGVEAAVTGVQQLGTPGIKSGPTPAERGPPEGFYLWFWGIALVAALIMLRYYMRMDTDRLEVIKLLTSSVMPLGILTVVVLAVILFGITTATESAGVGAPAPSSSRCRRGRSTGSAPRRPCS